MSDTLPMKVLSADHIEMRDACYKDMTQLIKKCADDAEAIPVTGREALLTLLEAIESNGATGFGLVGTPATSIEARLARGERGIPKIPDSPDTRHAQAQRPRCPECLSDSRKYGNPRPCVNEFHTAAEQPAPPLGNVKLYQNPNNPDHLRDTPFEQPSAPPQPAAIEKCGRGCSPCGVWCGLPAGHEGKHRWSGDGHEWEGDTCIRAAEPSVEARPEMTDETLLSRDKQAFNAGFDEGMEAAAKLVWQEFLTRKHDDPQTLAEQIMAKLDKLATKEQQNAG